MRPIVRFFLFPAIAGILLPHCYNFTMTRNVRRAIVNAQYNYYVDSLKSIHLNKKGNLVVEAEISKLNEKTTERERRIGCAEIEQDGKLAESKSIQVERVLFSACVPEKSETELGFHKTPHQKEDRNLEKTRTLITFERSLGNWEQLEIKHPERKPIPNWQGKISLRQLNWSEPAPGYSAFYPFAVSYDLVAGTIHSIGAPFGYVCLVCIGGGISAGNKSSPSAIESVFYLVTGLPFCGMYVVLSFLDGGEPRDN